MRNILVGKFGYTNEAANMTLNDLVNRLSKNDSTVYGMINGLDDLVTGKLINLNTYNHDFMNSYADRYFKEELTIINSNDHVRLATIFYNLKALHIDTICYFGEDNASTLAQLQYFAGKVNYNITFIKLNESAVASQLQEVVSNTINLHFPYIRSFSLETLMKISFKIISRRDVCRLLFVSFVMNMKRR